MLRGEGGGMGAWAWAWAVGREARRRLVLLARCVQCAGREGWSTAMPVKTTAVVKKRNGRRFGRNEQAADAGVQLRY